MRVLPACRTLTKVQPPELLRGALHVHQASVQQHGRAQHHGAVGLPVGRDVGVAGRRQPPAALEPLLLGCNTPRKDTMDIIKTSQRRKTISEETIE